jgi:hypothetical protein
MPHFMPCPPSSLYAHVDDIPVLSLILLLIENLLFIIISLLIFHYFLDISYFITLLFIIDCHFHYFRLINMRDMRAIC